MLSTPQRPTSLAVLTSGGDAAGMNAAVRAVVRTGLDAGLDVFAAEVVARADPKTGFLPHHLPGGEVAHGGVEDLAGRDEVVERGERLLERRLGDDPGAVDLLPLDRDAEAWIG